MAPAVPQARKNRNPARQTAKGGGARLHGAGIDIVSLTRVRQFLARHRDVVLRRFLSPSERKACQRIGTTEFAELFTAKEAFFKACGETWMGLDGFRGMTITGREGDRFRMQWRSAYSKKKYRGEGCFFRDGDIVGAQAMIWS
jgi:phosphopantetheine--protein transferase-like protein